MPGKLDNLDRTAESLIETFGAPATLQRVTTTFNASSGTTVETTADESIIVTPPEPFDQRRIDGTLIRESDLRTLMKGRSISAPSIGDRLTLYGETYQVVRSVPAYAGTVPAYYEIQLRA